MSVVVGGVRSLLGQVTLLLWALSVSVKWDKTISESLVVLSSLMIILPSITLSTPPSNTMRRAPFLLLPNFIDDITNLQRKSDFRQVAQQVSGLPSIQTQNQTTTFLLVRCMCQVPAILADKVSEKLGSWEGHTGKYWLGLLYVVDMGSCEWDPRWEEYLERSWEMYPTLWYTLD